MFIYDDYYLIKVFNVAVHLLVHVNFIGVHKLHVFPRCVLQG